MSKLWSSYLPEHGDKNPTHSIALSEVWSRKVKRHLTRLQRERIIP